jgi:hypothetical protein
MSQLTLRDLQAAIAHPRDFALIRMGSPPAFERTRNEAKCQRSFDLDGGF